jgi:MSHA biogenesis protein MshL
MNRTKIIMPGAIGAAADGSVSRLRLPLAFVLSAVVLTFLAGCQSWSRTTRDANLPASAERLRTTTDFVDAAELELPIESTTDVDFLLRRADDSDALPDVRLRNVSVTESGLYDAMNLIAASANLSLAIEGGARGLERYGATAVFRLSGTLTEVMEQLSEGMGFFYTVRNRMLVITPEQQFILQTPPALTEDNLAGFANNLQVLGARDTYLDRLNSTVAFRANRTTLRSIEQYVSQLRTARAMLIYEVHVYQVDLTDETKSGINWNRFGWTEDSIVRTVTGGDTGGTGNNGNTGGSGNTGAPPTDDVFAPFGSANRAATLSSDSGYGLSAVIAGPNFNGAILMNFLRSQGTVRVVSQPRIGLMSGSRGSLQVGQNTSYVAKVGTNIGNNLNQVTVETERLTTGFELTLYGTENGGAIYTDINLSISELLRFNSFTALGTDLTLPQTADRKVQTIVAARPGDVILLGGIAVGRDNADITNAIGGNSKETTVNRSELVIAIRPKVVRFVRRPLGSAAAAAANARLAPPAGASSAALPADWVESTASALTPADSVVVPPTVEPATRVAPPAAVAAPPAATVAVPTAVRAAPSAPGGVYRAQFGAYRSGPDAARAAWSVLQTTHPGLQDLTPDIVRESFGDQMLWLLRTAPMDRDQVQRLCSDVRRAGDPCAVVRSATAASGAVTEGGR